MVISDFLSGKMNFLDVFKLIKYKTDFRKKHPDYMDIDGLCIFCGSQGSGKTLSAVQYLQKLCNFYPDAILVTNTDIKGISNEIIEYDGIDCLKTIENGEKGVIYFIDEIHLEFNSLESKSIPIDIMTEVSQQRKQRKHIVGTSQVFFRLAKPLREQIKNVVICKNYFGFVQVNELIDGTSSYEENGKLYYDKVAKKVWFHNPDLYNSYDTYKKMKRYKKEWNSFSPLDIYERGL